MTTNTLRKPLGVAGRVGHVLVATADGEGRPHVAVAPPPPKATVRLLTGPNAGKVLELSKPVTTLGKPGVQVAVISRRPEGVYVTHVEGAKFPTVNGATLDGEAFLLEDKDVVEIAGIRMEVSIRP